MPAVPEGDGSLEPSSQEIYLAGSQASQQGWRTIDDGGRDVQNSKPAYYLNIWTKQVSFEQPEGCEHSLCWLDGSTLYIYRGRCTRCFNGEELRQSGPTLLSARKGSYVAAFNLCGSCLCHLVTVQAQNSLQSDAQYRRPELGWQQQHSELLMASDSVSSSPSPKCFYSVLEERYNRPNRSAEQHEMAVRARIKAQAEGEKRRKYSKGKAMRQRCLREFPAVGVGEYLCWNDKHGDRVHYYGTVVNVKANGIGLAEFEGDGSYYFGPFASSMPQTSANHPDGIFIWSDHRRYTGQMVAGMMQGQ